DRFGKAVGVTGARRTGTEPVAALVLHYEKELDLVTAAAELGLRATEFSEKLSTSVVLARALGSLKVSGGTVQRQGFNEAFSDLVTELSLGTYLPPQHDRP